jgi:hypothetical protein
MFFLVLPRLPNNRQVPKAVRQPGVYDQLGRSVPRTSVSRCVARMWHARPAALTHPAGSGEHVCVDKRSRWFDEGAATLRDVLDRQGRGHQLPPTGDYYACPCCLTVFSRAAVAARVLTIEDVPSKVLGGRPMLLTDVECNSSSGSGLTLCGARSDCRCLCPRRRHP